MSMLGNRRRRGFGEWCADRCAAIVAAIKGIWVYAAAVVMGVALVLGGIHAWRVFCDTEHFKLQEITVVGGGTMGPDEVGAACGLVVGKSDLFLMDEEEVASDCASDRRIRWARADIDLPGSVTIRLEEQVPLLYVATAFGLWEVNRYGEPTGPADMADLRDLPLVTGPTDADLTGKDAGDIYRDALSLVRIASGEGGPWAGQGLMVEYDRDLGYTLTGSDTGPRARFGWPPFGRKYERLVKALVWARGKSLTIGGVLLDNERRPKEVTLQVSLTARLASLAEKPGTGLRIKGLEDDHE